MGQKTNRNRAAEAKARGKRLCMFELSQEFDALIEAVAERLASEQGSCTRTQALERMGREGAKKILRKSRNGIDTD
jgi:hypothetical protein